MDMTPAPFNHARFAALVKEHRAFVLATLWRCGVRWDDCEDLAQDVFLQLHRSADKLDLERPCQGWLVVAARHCASDYHWKRRRERLGDNERAAQETEVDPSPLPDERVAVAWDAPRILELALSKLREERRRPFEMAELGGMSPEAIAEELGVGVNTVRSRIRRAREELHAELHRLGVIERRRARAGAVLPAFFFGVDALFEALRGDVRPAAAAAFPAEAGALSAGDRPASGLRALARSAGLVGAGAAAGALAMWCFLQPPGATPVANREDMTLAAPPPPPPPAPPPAPMPSGISTPPAAPARSTPADAWFERQEKALLNKAEGLFARNRQAEGCAALAEHERSYPRGVYKGQREALARAAGCSAGAR